MESVNWYSPLIYYVLIQIVLVLSFYFLRELSRRIKFEKLVRENFGFRESAELEEIQGEENRELTTHQEENDFESLRLRLKDYAVFMTDAAGMVSCWNREAAKLYHYQPEDIMGNSSCLFYTAEDILNQLPQYNQKMAGQQGTFVNEGWRVKKDGSLFKVNSFITALVNEDCQVSGYLEFLRDSSDTQYVQVRTDPTALDPAEAGIRLNRRCLAGCILNWHYKEPAEQLVLVPVQSRELVASSIEVMALSNPEVENTMKQVFRSGSWRPEMNFLNMQGYYFSELLRKNLMKSDGREITAIIFMVKYNDLHL